MIQIQRVVPKNLINELKLQQFQIAFIQAKHANKVIQILKGLQTLPIDTFFLKRVRRNKQQSDHEIYVQVILCLTQEKDQFINDIKQEFQETFQEQIIKEIKTIQLPRFAPASKKDFQQWTKYWPCNYLEPQFVKRIQHSKEQLTIIQYLYKVISHQQQNKNSCYLFSGQKYLLHLDGSSEKFSCTNSNPLQHPIMKLAQLWSSSPEYRQNQNKYYYMTNLRLILKSKSLCGMCAMGLVHSRVERIYFQEGSIPSEQILEILYNMKLNHKIELLTVKKAKKDENNKQKQEKKKK